MTTDPDRRDVVTMGLTWDSTREEVLAAVAEHERRVEESIAWIKANPDVMSTACRRVDPDRPLTGDKLLLERQKTAGEEDQSVPGWDQGA